MYLFYFIFIYFIFIYFILLLFFYFFFWRKRIREQPVNSWHFFPALHISNNCNALRAMTFCSFLQGAVMESTLWTLGRETTLSSLTWPQECFGGWRGLGVRTGLPKTVGNLYTQSHQQLRAKCSFTFRKKWRTHVPNHRREIPERLAVMHP